MKKIYSLIALLVCMLTCNVAAWAETQTIWTSNIGSSLTTPTAPEGWTLTLSNTSNKNQAANSYPKNLADFITAGVGSGKLYSTSLSGSGLITVKVPTGNKIVSVAIGLAHNSTGTSSKQIGHGAFSTDGTTYGDYQAISTLGYDNGAEVTLTPSTIADVTTFTFGRGAISGTKPSANAEARIYYIIVEYEATVVKTEVSNLTTLTGVTVNGTALEAGKLADLLANGTLDIAYKSTEAPEVVFNTLNTITYDDNTTKETAGVAEVTISGADGNYVATATVGENEYTINFNYVKTYTVSYGNAETNWENVYAYVWNGGDNNTWPGQLMTNTEEDYIWTIDLQGLSFEPANVIFSNGKNSDNGGQQTATLGFENGKTYGALPRVITFDNTKAGWENVNAYVWGDNDAKNAEWPGVAMTANGNIYTYTLCSSWEPTGVVFNNGNGGDQNQTVDLAYNAENAHYANASKMDETYVVKLPGVPAWEGDLVPSARPVKGIAKFTLNGAVSGEFKVLVNETWHGNGQALTIGEWINVAENGEPNLTYPAECADALCTFVEYNCITNEIRINVLNLVPVEGTTTWDFTSANSADVAGANGDGLEAFSAHEGWAEGFNADALAAKAQYLYYKSNNCFQGTRLVFNTTVDGTVKIEFSNTGNSNGTRSICINGVETKYGSTGSKSHENTEEIAVLAGTVEISGLQTAHDSKPETVGLPNQLRIFKVTFTEVEEYINIHFNNSDKNWEAPHVKYSTEGGLYVTKAMTKSTAHLVRTLDDGIEDETPKADIWTANIPANATHVTFSDGGENEYGVVFTGGDIADGLIYGPEGNQTGVESIEADANGAAPVYYNMQGVRVAEPTNGVYIVVRGSNVTKEIIR